MSKNLVVPNHVHNTGPGKRAKKKAEAEERVRLEAEAVAEQQRLAAEAAKEKEQERLRDESLFQDKLRLSLQDAYLGCLTKTGDPGIALSRAFQFALSVRDNHADRFELIFLVPDHERRRALTKQVWEQFKTRLPSRTGEAVTA